jgi:hypothetical protein
MNRKLSYIDINNQDLKSLYKLYYTNKLVKNLWKDTDFNKKAGTTSFIFYGTIIAVVPIKRIEFNKGLNNKVDLFNVDLSIIPYSNFKSRIRFSNLSKTKARLKGDILFQMKITFSNKEFLPNKTLFEIQAKIYMTIISGISRYIDKVSPLVIYIPTKEDTLDTLNDKRTPPREANICIRYNSMSTWMTKHNQEIQIGFNLLHIVMSPQIKRMGVVIYNQIKEIKSLAR